MNVWSVPPPNHNRSLFRLVYGEDLEDAPGHQQLLPILWEMGILPEVYLLPGDFRAGELPQSREEAVRGNNAGPQDRPEGPGTGPIEQNISRKSMIRDRGDLSPFGVLKRDN